MRRTLWPLALLLLIFVAACTTETASSPSATATEEEQATDEPTDEATDDAGGEETPNPFGDLDLNQDRALEELLPDEVGGATMFKFSFAGEEFMEGADEEFIALLDRLGASGDDVSVASAGDEEGNLDLNIGAFRIRGADTNQIEDEFRSAVENAPDAPVELTEENIGGKDVWHGFDEDMQAEVYFYAAGDVLFFVQTADRDLAEEALAALP